MKQKRSCDKKNTENEATKNSKTKIQDHKLESILLHPAGLVKQGTPYCPRALSAYAFNKLTMSRSDKVAIPRLKSHSTMLEKDILEKTLTHSSRPPLRRLHRLLLKLGQCSSESALPSSPRQPPS